MNTSEHEMHQATKNLQELADEVERERKQRGHTPFDEVVEPHGDAEGKISGDEVQVADDDAPSPNATVFGRVQQQNSPN